MGARRGGWEGLAMAAALLWLGAGCADSEGPGAGALHAEAPAEGPALAGWEGGEATLAASDAPARPVALPGTPSGGEAPAPRLVAHEWGTFTSVQGTDGGTLEGLHHEEEALPPFVHDRCGGMDGCLNPTFKSLEVLPEPVTQKLETPVIYLHAREAMQVAIEVDFPEGVISQWYPEAASMAPEIGTLGAVADGAMAWHVTADPAQDPAAAPWVPSDDVWAPSRAVQATPLSVAGEVERFIFYRGLGRFEMPVRVRTGEGGALAIANESADALPEAFLLHVRDGEGSVVSLGPVDAHAVRVAEPPVPALPMDAYIAAAKGALADALEASGLYADEAAAMVDTWERSWFEGEGLRLLYVVPRAWTDALLPIAIEPAPDALVRTLVGRIELLTPAEEAAAREAVLMHHGAGTRPVPADSGRFWEPRLRRACGQLADEVPAAWCQALIEDAAVAVP